MRSFRENKTLAKISKFTVFYGKFNLALFAIYSKACVNGHFQKTKDGFQDQLLLNAGRMYCRMLQREHSAKILTFIKLSVVIKTFVLPIFEWPFYTGFTVR